MCFEAAGCCCCLARQRRWYVTVCSDQRWERESSELAGVWKGAVLLHLEVLLQCFPGMTEENYNKLDTEGVLARVRASHLLDVSR
jgi:hypothetical protein